MREDVSVESVTDTPNHHHPPHARSSAGPAVPGRRSVRRAVTGFARSFLPGAMPAMSRRNYAWELRSVLLMPAAVACVEGNVVGVIAKKGFVPRVGGEEAHPSLNYVVAALAAAGPLAMLSSMLWTRLFHQRDRVRCVNVLQLSLLGCVLGLAMAPFNWLGIAMLLLFTLLARSLATGIVTARSDIWRANYPRRARARATGRLTILTTAVVALTSVAIALVMDVERLQGHGFRVVYVGAIGVAGVGVWAFSHIRWRGRAQHMARERSDADVALNLPGPRSMLRVLRDDRWYRRFMVAQFVLGAPNLASAAVFIIAMEDVFAPNYTRSIALAHVIPLVMPILTIPMWAHLLDRMHIIRFRVYHSWFFVAANALIGIAMIVESEPLLVLSRVVLGVAFAGGMLAWALGHHDFATRELASIYMGIHATLTGVRGFIAPFLGTLLYQGLTLRPAGPHVPGLGGWTFIVLAGIGAIAALMFLRMQIDLTRGLAPARNET